MSLRQADRQRFLEAAIEVAEMAGERADRWFHQRDQLVVEEKGAQDYVSAADKETEALIVDQLRQRFPDHAFLGEEGDKARPRPGQPLWVIDPIDGTTNFLRGIPLWAVSVGLVVDGEPEVGVLHLPRLNELYTASKGGGAFLDGEKIRPASTTALARSAVGLGSSARHGPDALDALQAGLNKASVDVRRFGSACVQQAWVACGRLDGYLELHLNSWDVAASLVILREAGALTNDFTRGNWLHDGNPYVCAAPGVFKALSAIGS